MPKGVYKYRQIVLYIGDGEQESPHTLYRLTMLPRLHRHPTSSPDKPRKKEVNSMGRITPSWRQIFHNLVFTLRSNNNCFYNSLRNPQYQVAFDQLIKAWSRESAAMGNAGIPCMPDILHLMANIHIRRCIEDMKTTLQELEMHVT